MLTLFQLPAFRNAYVVRGFLVWIALRLVQARGGTLNPGPIAEVLTLLAVGAAVGLDAWRRDEDLFLANLGVPALAIALCALPAAVVAELLVP